MIAAAAAVQSPLLLAALSYAGRGWRVIPLHGVRRGPNGTACTCGRGAGCTSQGKHPRIDNWVNDGTTDEATIRDWWSRWPTSNVGIVTGAASGLMVIDVDPDHGGNESLAELCDEYGQLPETVEADTGGGGLHLLFAHPGRPIRGGAGIKCWLNRPGLDVRGDGGMIVATPSAHVSGSRYAWRPGQSPDDLSPRPMPEWLLQLHDDARRPAATAAQGAQGHPGRRFGDDDPATHWLGKALARATAGNRNDTGFWLAGQLRDAGLSESAARDTLRAYAERVPQNGVPYTVDEAEASVRSAFSAPAREPARANGATASLARRANGNAQRTPPADPSASVPPPAEQPKQGDDKVATLNTDVGNGARFARLHGSVFRFCFSRGQWLRWSGKRWEWDVKGYAVTAAKETALSIYTEAQAENQLASQAQAKGDEAAAARHAERSTELLKWAATSQKRERIAAMLAMAQPDLAIIPEELDADPMLLNVGNGVVDLRTGQLRPHRPEDYVTKLCRADYRPGTAAAVFDAFLARTFRTHPALSPYVQSVLGYCATGATGEQAMFFLYGRGSNGKTTLIDAVMHALGDYAAKADPDLLMARDGSAAHPCNVADLMGRRMVVCSETNEGKRFDEARLKDLVGETRLKARFLYGDFFQFVATHKVLLYSNHLPVVRGTDHGFWRRMKLIPFVETISEDEKDTSLLAKLEAEADGILAWIVAGAVRWHRHGLATPPEVAEATKAYRSEMDSIGMFLAECCIEGEKLYATARDLYAAYSQWCQDAGERPLSQKRLGTALTERGLHNERCSTTGRKEWRGIGLKTPPESYPNGPD